MAIVCGAGKSWAHTVRLVPELPNLPEKTALNDSRATFIAILVTSPLVFFSGSSHAAGLEPDAFEWVGTFDAFQNESDKERGRDKEAVAEIVTSSGDGQTLVYTDGKSGSVGFVDITNVSSPRPLGGVSVGGEPTSVAVIGGYALACVNTSTSHTSPSGKLQVLNIKQRKIIHTINLDGQPDSIAVGPDGRYAAIAIENERDEELGDGSPPQSPAGYLLILDLGGTFDDWSVRRVGLYDASMRFPDDAEPEFVAVNADNVAAVTLQENNHLFIIDLADGKTVSSFTAGHVAIEIDHSGEDGESGLARRNMRHRPREPDGVCWITSEVLATADEGDLSGGTRGFTIWTTEGRPIFTSGGELDSLLKGDTSKQKWRKRIRGVEPESIAYDRYGKTGFMFVGLERADVVLVYQFDKGCTPDECAPNFVQVLKTGAGPEGIHTIPSRGLLVVANEADDPSSGRRSSIMIYRLRQSRVERSLAKPERP